MKAILKFTLPEEHVEFHCSINGVKWSSAMWNLEQYLRNKIKYESEEMSKDTFKAFYECREKLHEILNEEGLKL